MYCLFAYCLQEFTSRCNRVDGILYCQYRKSVDIFTHNYVLRKSSAFMHTLEQYCSRRTIYFWLQICTIIYKNRYIPVSVLQWIWEEDTHCWGEKHYTEWEVNCARDIRKHLLEWLTKSLRLNVIDDISSILSIRSLKGGKRNKKLPFVILVV